MPPEHLQPWALAGGKHCFIVFDPRTGLAPFDLSRPWACCFRRYQIINQAFELSATRPWAERACLPIPGAHSLCGHMIKSRLWAVTASGSRLHRSFQIQLISQVEWSSLVLATRLAVCLSCSRACQVSPPFSLNDAKKSTSLPSRSVYCSGLPLPAHNHNPSSATVLGASPQISYSRFLGGSEGSQGGRKCSRPVWESTTVANPLCMASGFTR